MKKNLIFYHLLCVNDAQFRFERTYKKLKITGLLDVCYKIILVMVGKYRYEYSKQVANLIQDNKIVYIFSDIDTSEVVTINLIYETAIKQSFHREDCNILYLHSKGITRPHLTPQMIGWMDYMEYFLIEEFTRCLKVLEEYKSCGVLFRDGLRIYGGNFWWARSDYVRMMKPLSTTCWRFDCEHWLLNNDVPAFNLSNKFDWCWGFYEKVCKREEYTDLPPIVEDYSILPFLNDSEVNINYARFGGIDCKDKIKNCIINNRIYLRSDITIVNNVHVDYKDRYLDIEINGKTMRLANEQYLIYGY